MSLNKTFLSLSLFSGGPPGEGGLDQGEAGDHDQGDQDPEGRRPAGGQLRKSGPHLAGGGHHGPAGQECCPLRSQETAGVEIIH